MIQEMKDSGIKWIGEIPTEWDIKPLKYVSSNNEAVLSESTPSDYGFRYVDIGAVNADKGIASYKDMTFDIAPSRARKKVSEGDTIISTVRTYLKAIAFVDDAKNVIVSTGFSVRSPLPFMFPKFLYYFCISDGFIDEVNKFSTGVTYPAIGDYLLGKISVAIPPLAEQQAIANLLDVKCAKLDSVIADLERQIEILQEYKKSVITNAVTKGLNPSVPMKDSGVEWIGEIPVHWEVKRLKYLLKNNCVNIRVGPFGSALSTDDIKDDGYWVYNQRCVLDENFTDNDTFIDERKYAELKSFSVFPNDLLITTRGTIGKVAIVPNNAPTGILHPCIIKFVIDNHLMSNELIRLIFNESSLVSDQLFMKSNATTIDVIYSYTLKEILLPVIPLSEQNYLLEYLYKKSARIEAVLLDKMQELKNTKQHKSSLIYEYVTGKKRVKEAAINAD